MTGAICPSCYLGRCLPLQPCGQRQHSGWQPAAHLSWQPGRLASQRAAHLSCQLSCSTPMPVPAGTARPSGSSPTASLERAAKPPAHLDSKKRRCSFVGTADYVAPEVGQQQQQCSPGRTCISLPRRRDAPVWAHHTVWLQGWGERSSSGPLGAKRCSCVGTSDRVAPEVGQPQQQWSHGRT